MRKTVEVNDGGEAAQCVGKPVRGTLVPRRIVVLVMNQADAQIKDTDVGRAVLDKLHEPLRRGRQNIMLTQDEMDYLNAICLHNSI